MPDAGARAALAAWGGRLIRPVLIRENAVYEVEIGGIRAALRLHRPGYQSAESIASELWWCAALAEAGFPAPRPIPCRAGSLTAPAGDRLASLVTWLNGAPIGAFGTPLAGSPAEQSALFTRIGALTAALHNATDALTLPPWFTRPAWDAPALLGEAPRWGPFWANPALSDSESALLQQARTEALQALAGRSLRLIHADLMRENLLDGSQGLALIDFDDSGWGFAFYDLASALIQNAEEPALPRLAAALIEGYGRHRPLPPEPARELTLMLMLRSFASCGWIVSRFPPGDPRQRLYAERALRMARLWLDGRAL